MNLATAPAMPTVPPAATPHQPAGTAPVGFESHLSASLSEASDATADHGEAAGSIAEHATTAAVAGDGPDGHDSDARVEVPGPDGQDGDGRVEVPGPDANTQPAIVVIDPGVDLQMVSPVADRPEPVMPGLAVVPPLPAGSISVEPPSLAADATITDRTSRQLSFGHSSPGPLGGFEPVRSVAPHAVAAQPNHEVAAQPNHAVAVQPNHAGAVQPNHAGAVQPNHAVAARALAPSPTTQPGEPIDPIALTVAGTRSLGALNQPTLLDAATDAKAGTVAPSVPGQPNVATVPAETAPPTMPTTATSELSTSNSAPAPAPVASPAAAAPAPADSAPRTASEAAPDAAPDVAQHLAAEPMTSSAPPIATPAEPTVGADDSVVDSEVDMRSPAPTNATDGDIDALAAKDSATDSAHQREGGNGQNATPQPLLAGEPTSTRESTVAQIAPQQAVAEAAPPNANATILATGAVANADAVAAQSSTPIDAPVALKDLGASTARFFNEMQRNGETQRRIVMRLDPPELGPVTLELMSSGDDVVVAARTDSSEAMRALMRQRPALDVALDALGLNLSQFDVRSDSDDERERRHDAPRRGRSENDGGTNARFEQPTPTNPEGGIFL